MRTPHTYTHNAATHNSEPAMKGSTAAVLLTLSLAAFLLLAGPAVANDSIIRLHSGDGEGGMTEETRPWECCDNPVCTRSKTKPLCGCKDVVEQCSDACKNCKPAKRADESAPSGFMCRDAYRGFPGPKCML